MTHPADLHEAGREFEALAQSAPDAIFTIDEASTILFANSASERVFGYAPGELIGRRLTDVIPERLRATHEAGLARYLKSGRRNIPWTGVELPGLRKDGSEIPLEISFGELVTDDGRRIFSGFMRDVSERALHRQELESARAIAESALRELASVGRIMDLAMSSGTYEGMMERLLQGLRGELHADEASVLLLDEKTQELVPQSSDGLDLEPATRIPIGEGLAGRVVRSGRSLVIEDLSTEEVVHPALRREITSLVIVPMRSDEELIGVLHVGTRERRRFSANEARVLEIIGERMAGVMARARLFQAEQRAREAAERAQRARDEVLSIVSHDLRNPVNTVMMSASLLADPDIHLTQEQQHKQLDVIRRSAERMSRLIQDLVDVARIEGGRLVITSRTEDAAALASETVEAFRAIAARKSQRLESEIAAGLPAIRADRDRIIQVLSNYLSNAVKFAPQGGRIVVRVFGTNEGGVRFGVEDDGPGISQDDIARVFDRFWQAKRTAHMGSGLGLAIAKGIVEAHGGRVWAESAPGQTIFSFELPVDGDPRLNAPATNPPSARPRTARTADQA